MLIKLLGPNKLFLDYPILINFVQKKKEFQIQDKNQERTILTTYNSYKFLFFTFLKNDLSNPFFQND